MLLRFNLLPSEHLPIPEKSQFLRIWDCTVPFFILIIGFTLVPDHVWPSTSPLDRWAQLSFFEDVRSRCEEISSTDPNIAQLKDTFLSNKKLTDSQLRESFQQSGLAHLLALSGGQTSPAAKFLTTFFIFFLSILLRINYKFISINVIRSLRLIALLADFAIVAFLVGLYRSTGALNRILSTRLTSFLFFFGREGMKSHTASRNSHLARLALAILPWCFALTLGKNPASDLSFLLSMLGSLTLQWIGSCLAERLHLDDTLDTNQTQRRLSHLTRLLSLWILSSAFTSSAVSLMCFQLWPTDNLTNKILANLLAGPVIGCVVTPAALLVTFSVIIRCDPLQAFGIQVLEFGLKAFLEIALAFADAPNSTPHSANLGFPKPGQTQWPNHPYLLLHLMIACLSGLNEWKILERLRKIENESREFAAKSRPKTTPNP